eukprot:11935041-Alexandrium_andersonii.AAC.1
MWASYKLRKDDLLRETTVESFLAVCPPLLAAWARGNQGLSLQVMPSKSTISRLRRPSIAVGH